jgi:hypothetical protein
VVAQIFNFDILRSSSIGGCLYLVWSPELNFKN